MVDENLLGWRHVEDVFKTCLEDVFKWSSRPTNVCWAVGITSSAVGLKICAITARIKMYKSIIKKKKKEWWNSVARKR